jgi:hypothetical protein
LAEVSEHFLNPGFISLCGGTDVVFLSSQWLYNLFGLLRTDLIPIALEHPKIGFASIQNNLNHPASLLYTHRILGIILAMSIPSAATSQQPSWVPTLDISCNSSYDVASSASLQRVIGV